MTLHYVLHTDSIQKSLTSERSANYFYKNLESALKYLDFDDDILNDTLIPKNKPRLFHVQKDGIHASNVKVIIVGTK